MTNNPEEQSKSENITKNFHEGTLIRYEDQNFVDTTKPAPNGLKY
jgi:hypothetical protein